MIPFYNQDEYENIAPSWVEENAFATAKATYLQHTYAQVAYPAVQNSQYNYGLGGQIHQIQNCSEQEKWELLAAQISFLYNQRKYGLWEQMQPGQEVHYLPTPQANYSYDDHQDFGCSEDLVGQYTQNEYYENNEGGHQFQEEICHARQVDYYDHQEHGWSQEMVGQNNEEEYIENYVEAHQSTCSWSEKMEEIRKCCEEAKQKREVKWEKFFQNTDYLLACLKEEYTTSLKKNGAGDSKVPTGAVGKEEKRLSPETLSLRENNPLRRNYPQ